MKFIKSISNIFVVIITFFLFGNLISIEAQDSTKTSVLKPKVTFIELGSVNCIPCRKMQPIMKSIEKRYGSQIKVLFYDVWKPEQKENAKKYKIRVIPTQVFLDENGNEFFRHEGFFPEEEIDKILQKRGLKPKS